MSQSNNTIFAAVFGSLGTILIIWCLFGYCYYRKYKLQLIEYKEKEQNCCINLACCLPVLFYASLRIYCQPLMHLLCLRCLEQLCCYYCRNHKTEWYYFTDKHFPPNQRSLGIKNRNVTWIRANHFEIDNQIIELKTSTEPNEETKDEHDHESQTQNNNEMYLFSDGIEPSDVCQGALGDCWLIAALAALAEFPGTIENTFHTLEKQKNGKYMIRLYDARFKDIKKKRKKIVIDDYIPCDKGDHKPLFSKPNGNEMWVLLLEKAFAKFCGSYGNLNGGQTIYALQAITGDTVFILKYETYNRTWSKYDVVMKDANIRRLSVNPFDDWFMKDTKERFDSLRLWNIIKKYYESGGLITCAITSSHGEDRNESLGIVAGHAYTILKIVEFKKYNKLKLLQLRNPWGTFSWNGKWSNKCESWQTYNDIAIKLNHNMKDKDDDGIFWIQFEDFQKLYNRIYICDKSSVKNLHIDVRESEGFWGVFKGCLLGCIEFWCCCRGLMEIYFGRVSSTDTIKVNKCCLCCCKDDGHSWTAI